MKRNQHKPVDAAELRRGAEERLKRQKPAGREQRTELGTARLVHELQVHQIELEMQNEELRQARTGMETLLAQYTNLYDFAPTGYLNLDREGAIRQVNLTGARLLGVERSRLMNRLFGLFVSDDFRPAFNAFLQKVFASHTKECCEVALLNKGRRPLFVRIDSVISEDGQECLVMVVDITERWRAEEQALRESEARHRTILRTAMDGFWLVDLQGRLLEVNETYCRMSGYSEQELLALSISDLEAAETPTDTAVHFQRVAAQGEDRFESRHRRKDGSSFAVEASVQYKPAEGGQIVVFLRDITERKQAEEAVRESEERTARIVASAMDAIISVDSQQRVVSFNAAAEKMFGHRAADMLEEPLDRFIPQRFRDHHHHHFEAFAATGVTTRTIGALGQISGMRANGEEFPIEASISQIGEGAQKLFTVILRDITERKRAEQALRESEASYRTLIESASDGIFIADAQGRYVDVNALGCRLLGYAREELLALSVPDVVATKETARVAPELAALKVGEVVCSEWQFRRKDGTLFLGEVSGTILPDGRLLGILRDITERKQAEEALRAQNVELQILRETSQTILASRNIQNMAASILEKAIAVSLCDVGVIRLLDRTSRALNPIASRGYLNPKNLQLHHRHLDDGTTGRLLRVFARKETVVLERVQDEPGLRIFKREGVQSLILIPVLAEHDLLGALQLGSRTPRKFDPHLINLLETLGSNFGIAVQKIRLLAETVTSQAQLRALSRRLVKTQESERHYLARELHDEIGSLLTGLKLTLGVPAGSGTDQIDARTAAAYKIIDEALAKTRSLSHSLRPPMLDDLGLLPALSWHVKEFTARTDVQVNFQHHDLQLRFPEEVEIAAYRIVQEALTNIARHAQVHEATVTLWADPSGLGIEISDQGAGFDQTAATLANASSAGLAGIRERVASLGGSLKITSAPGTGTSVTVELPLAMGEKTVRSEQ